MCSMPQKQPAASVALSAPSGTFMLPELDSGVKRRELEVKGRVKRWMMEFMVGKLIIAMRKMRNFVMGFRIADLSKIKDEIVMLGRNEI